MLQGGRGLVLLQGVDLTTSIRASFKMTEQQGVDILAALNVLTIGLEILIIAVSFTAGLQAWEIIRYALNCKRFL